MAKLMRSSINRNISFDELWEEVKGCYRSLDFRCIAIKEGESWKNVFFTAFLSRKSVDDVRRKTYQEYSSLINLGINDLGKLGIFYNVVEAHHIQAYIKQIQNGRITLCNNIIHLRDGWKKSFVSGGLRIIKFGEYAEYPVINYDIYSETLSGISEELRNKLLTLGFLNTLNELGSQWLKMPYLENYNLNGVIVFPIYLNVIDISMNDKKEFNIKFKLHRHFYSKLKILISLRRKVEENYLMVENRLFSFNEIPASSLDEDFLICEVRHGFNKLPRHDDQIYFRIPSRLGILYYNLIFVEDLIRKKKFREEPLFKKFILSYLKKYGYQPDKNYNAGNISSLEWHVYHLLSPIFPTIWIGLKEEYWKEVFKELGFDETVDFILFINNSVVLIECIQKYTTSKGDVGEREVRKLLYLKEKFSKMGFTTYPVLICGENYEDNKAYLEKRIREDIYFIFNEGLKQMKDEVDLIKNPRDLLKYSKTKISEKRDSYIRNFLNYFTRL